MGQLEVRRDAVAVVRVEIREAAADALLVDLLEVGRDRGADRRIGRATDPASAGRILRDWLSALLRATGEAAAAETGWRRGRDDGVTLPRRSRAAPARGLPSTDRR